jgi:hypothetical protein
MVALLPALRTVVLQTPGEGFHLYLQLQHLLVHLIAQQQQS